MTKLSDLADPKIRAEVRRACEASPVVSDDGSLVRDACGNWNPSPAHEKFIYQLGESAARGRLNVNLTLGILYR